MFTNYCRNNTKKKKSQLKFSMRKNQNVSTCINALPLLEMGIKLKTRFGFTAEKYTK